MEGHKPMNSMKKSLLYPVSYCRRLLELASEHLQNLLGCYSEPVWIMLVISN